MERRPAAPGIGVRLLLAAAFAWGGFVLVGPPLVVSAEVSPGCGAHITNKDGDAVDVAGVNSQDSSTAIAVTVDQVVKLDIIGETGTPATVHVDYGLTDRFPFGKDGSGTSYSARVSDYVYMSGLYLVRARTGPNGVCTAAALVNVEGNPLGGPVGDGALAAAAVGLGGLGAGTAAALMGGGDSAEKDTSEEDDDDKLAHFDPNTGKPWTPEQLARLNYLETHNPGEAEMWARATPAERSSMDLADMAFGNETLSWVGCVIPALLALAMLPVLLLVRAAMVVMPGADGGAVIAPASVPVAPLRLPRRRWRPLFSVSGILGGLVGSVGVVVLLQQSGKIFPTTNVLVRALLAGLLVGIALPSAARAVKVRRGNRRIAAVEARANAARSRRGGWGSGATAAATASYAPTHVVPAGGLDAWDAPDPSRSPVDRLDAGLDVQVTERSGNWARVLCSNGWSAWVDGRGLQELQP